MKTEVIKKNNTEVDYLEGVMNGKTTIPTKTWKEEYTKLIAERKMLNQRYLALKEEVKAAMRYFLYTSISTFTSHSGPYLHQKKRHTGKHPIRRRAKIIFRTERGPCFSPGGGFPWQGRRSRLPTG